jgi:membrane associated rhomboid family serine protease
MFFLPIGDEPNPPGRQPVTWWLMMANCAVFLLITLPLKFKGVNLSDPMLNEYLNILVQQTGEPARYLLGHISAYDVFVYEYGFRSANPSAVPLVSSLFLHAGWMHLLGNMLFLWIYGDNVEYRLGPKAYLLLYFGAGVGATLFHSMAFGWSSNTPLIGASGAISGVLGAYFIWFPRNRVKILFVLFWFVQVILVPARFVLGIYILWDNVLPWLFSGDSGGVAHGAHIGGFLVGLAVAYWLSEKPLEGAKSRPVKAAETPEEMPEPTPVRPKNVDYKALFLQAAQTGDHLGAAEMFSQMRLGDLMRLDEEVFFSTVDALSEGAHFPLAIVMLQRYVGTHPQGEGLAEAHLRLGLLQFEQRKRFVTANQHLLTVLDLDPEPGIESRARQALDEIKRLQKQRDRGETLH